MIYTGLNEGEHSVTLDLALPSGAVMSGEVSVPVSITRVENNSVVTETETEETTTEETESITVATESESTAEPTEEQ